MKLTEIEKCPWCGGEIHSIHNVYPSEWYLICYGCGYKTGKHSEWSAARNEYEKDKEIKKK